MPPAQPDGAIEMHDQANEFMDRIADQAKRKAGEMLETSRVEREGRARARAQDAQELEQLAQDQRREAAEQHGQQMAQQDR